MKKSIHITLLLAMSLSAASHTFMEGKTYEFAEKDLLVVINEKINNERPQLQARLDEAKERIRGNIENYKPDDLNKLPPATQDRVFYPDMTYTLEMDIPDAEGRIIYPKGYSYNISDYISLPYEIVVFDATDPKQLAWVIENEYHTKAGELLMITDGQPFKLMREFKKPVYFALNKVQERFKLEHTPSKIIQMGNKIKITEVCLSCTKPEEIKK
ncbi:MAG: hypothetical protein U9Q62_08550 [Campylobacterota bacterium]|nr:hypothetical protein [Campylobacterota bacterium]